MELDALLDSLDPLADVRLDPFTDYADALPLISIFRIRALTISNISAIVGAPKSRKTSFAVLLAAAFLSGDIDPIRRESDSHGSLLWIDTEQSPADCQRVYRRIARLRGIDQFTPMDVVTLLHLRDKEPAERLAITRKAIETCHPALVVIDGIADLITSNNDEAQASNLQNFLLAASSLHSCHILTVIHSNPGSAKARGHTGSNLTRKCETIMYVTRRKDKSVVTFTTRGPEIPQFMFELESDATPIPSDDPTVRHSDYIHMVDFILSDNEGLTYATLVRRILDYRRDIAAPISERWAKTLVADLLKKELLEKRSNGTYQKGRLVKQHILSESL